MRFLKWLIAGIASTAMMACSVTPPDNVKVIDDFDVNRYLGTWYEIARLDHSFERGLNYTTATYSLRDDGGIKVVNRGFNSEKNQWKESEGKGYFTGSPNRAALKVSFFGPFYGGYNVIALDKQYQYALVCGPNRDYLWILSRTPQLNESVKQQLLEQAKQNGFDVDKLIWVKQH